LLDGSSDLRESWRQIAQSSRGRCPGKKSVSIAPLHFRPRNNGAERRKVNFLVKLVLCVG